MQSKSRQAALSPDAPGKSCSWPLSVWGGCQNALACGAPHQSVRLVSSNLSLLRLCIAFPCVCLCGCECSLCLSLVRTLAMTHLGPKWVILGNLPISRPLITSAKTLFPNKATFAGSREQDVAIFELVFSYRMTTFRANFKSRALRLDH